MLGLFSDLGSAAFGLICSHEQHVTVQTEEPPTSSEIRPATNCCLTWISRFLEEVQVFGDKFMLFRKICNFVVLWTIIITRAVNRKLEKLEQKPEKVFKKSQESDSLSFPYCFYIPINGRENSALIID